MPSSYEELLRQAALAVAIAPDQLLQTEEIEIDGNVIGVSHEPAADGPGDIHLFTQVGRLAANADASQLRGLLEANYLGAGTGGCTLGVQQDTGTVMLWARFALERLDGAALTGLLGDFADVADFWRGRLEAPEGERRIVSMRGVSA
ncbi:type III secretion system chaperone [Cupriavidus respiraculi]|uniref:Type III secretion system chaperone n=1 Tax=Cupriavidus respiraculi TaxID=195930 RepID=A0ABM8XP98_9BURK|nr:type III secretion system chaperone [Cupriavidus respiraculi]MBY4946386.1 type III secretion system chaperone [Cupriavidus respiraculi]CAG9182061.1 hypothetical protein LMG21510_04461 [Cupriavidus respiraculi]